MQRLNAERATPDPKLLVLSPHLDDAVFGCGEWLAAEPGAVVVTVFAGRPEKDLPLTEWDHACGFHPDADVIGARRTEDQCALNILRATPIWLEFQDSQYGDSPRCESIADALEKAIGPPAFQTILFPLGLFHSDHQLTCNAALSLAKRYPLKRWVVYEDALYRQIAGRAAERLQTLREKGWSLQPIPFTGDTETESRKRQAVACYQSQLRALRTPGRPGIDDIYRNEGYWILLSVEGSR